MKDIKKAQQRLVNAIVAMHPQLCMGDEKQEELYLAMHDLTSKMAKLNECGGECLNDNSGLHLQRVSCMLPSQKDIDEAVCKHYDDDDTSLAVERQAFANGAEWCREQTKELLSNCS